MTRRLNWFLLTLIVLIGLPYYWLLIDNRPGDARPKPVTIAQLRALAGAMPGPAPSGVEVELIAHRRVPGTLFAAGTGLKRRLIGVMVWRLPVPGKGPIVIDSGMDQAAASAMEMEQFDSAAFQRVETVLRQASLILLTHEHPDHIGGLAVWRDATKTSRAQLNRPQMETLQAMRRTQFPIEAGPAPYSPFTIAPGVVVIPAASHTRGSQMIFVRLAGGREYLFTGDIATLASSWQELRARSRLIGEYFAPEDRREVFSWLMTIRALKAANPDLVILPGHDYEWVISPENRTGVRHGFTGATD